MSRPTPTEVERFVSDWVETNLQVHSGVTNLPLEVDRLAAHLTGDARIRNISGSDMHRALGDLDAYLTERYLQAAAA